MILTMLLNSLLRFLFIFAVLISSRLANAQDSKVETTSSNFQPSLFVVIGVLCFMFSLTFFLLLYAKMCYQEPTAIQIRNPNQNIPNNRGMFGTHTRFSGLNIEVVEALPFFRFSALKGAKQGLQCSVCLAEFEDIEILRLLPKCKHGFHIECIDQWLENHSTCPLCRQKVSIDDVNGLINSSPSMRLMIEGKSDSGEPSSNLEIFIEREDEERSSMWDAGLFPTFSSMGNSFRRIVNNAKPRMQVVEPCNLHRLNHQIVVSDVVFKNRWSDVSSSDLMFLNSEMLGIMSSDRISSSNTSCGKLHNGKIDEIGQVTRSSSNSNSNSRLKIETGRGRIRAMSEITALSRFKDLKSMKYKLRQCLKEPENDYYSNDDDENNRDDIKRRNKWFPIAKRTVQWFANRENNRSHEIQRSHQGTCHNILDV